MGPRRGVCAAAARTALARRVALIPSSRRPRCCAVVVCRGRGFASAPPHSPQQQRVPSKVAVIGGGLTGLATAHYLAMLLPATSQIVLYEGSGRTGGWIDSGKIKAATGTETGTGTGTGTGSLPAAAAPETFESGARMVAPQKKAVRFDDLLLLELVDQLKLQDELRVSSLLSNQYIYYPDHIVSVSLLNNMPSTAILEPQPNRLTTGVAKGLLRITQNWLYYKALLSWAMRCLRHIQREPAFAGMWRALLGFMVPSAENQRAEHARMVAASKAPGRVPPPSSDESVGDFIMRRTSGQARPLVNNMVSALMHGIYGGDVWKLSIASSVFRSSWLAESVLPVFQLYSRQAKIAEIRRMQAVAKGGDGARPENHPDFPGQNDGEGGGVAGFPPLTKETLALANAYDSGAARERKLVAMESDMALLNDIVQRMRARHDRWEETTKNLPVDERGRSPADGLGALGAASTRWTQFGFAKGFGTLTDALTRSLRSRPNVRIQTGEPVTEIKYDGESERVCVVTEQQTQAQTQTQTQTQSQVKAKVTGGELFDKAIATVASPTLFRLTGGGSAPSGGLLPALRREHAVTIMVVNLYYAEPALHHPYRGFGYLIPQSVPLDQNPEGALGVIFDSDREIDTRPLWDEERQSRLPMDLDDVEERSRRDLVFAKRLIESARARDKAADERGSKYTVMLGGHYWDGYRYPDDYPTPDEAVRMAESVLQRHLRDTVGFYEAPGHPMPRPVATHTKLCRECIPQHYVGHSERMAAAHDDLVRSFGGKLAVAGGSYTAVGPGVLPSVRSAYDVALRVAGRGYRTAEIRNGRNETDMAHVGDTGLGRFADPATDGVIPATKRKLPLRFNNRTTYQRGQWLCDGNWVKKG
ncbi:oxygen-dependent protoporphyrinogen oxidase [Sporothrix curviconia]|uniref:Oxygen-dependent protoporphyrinogen oxidase n=1 Tax=Sporothrix curviconia TaxID=1260050 RepID=A0ABP0C274_9PEZI